VRVLDRRSTQLDLSCLWMLNLVDHTSRQHLRVAKCLGNVIDGRKRHAFAFQSLQPKPVVLRLQTVGQNPDQLISVRHPVPVGLVFWVLTQGIQLHDSAECPKLSIIAGTDHDVRVAGLEDLIRYNRRVGGTHPLGFLTGDEIAGANVGQSRDLGLEQGAVDVLAESGSVACK